MSAFQAEFKRLHLRRNELGKYSIHKHRNKYFWYQFTVSALCAVIFLLVVEMFTSLDQTTHLVGFAPQKLETPLLMNDNKLALLQAIERKKQRGDEARDGFNEVKIEQEAKDEPAIDLSVSEIIEDPMTDYTQPVLTIDEMLNLEISASAKVETIAKCSAGSECGQQWLFSQQSICLYYLFSSEFSHYEPTTIVIRNALDSMCDSRRLTISVTLIGPETFALIAQPEAEFCIWHATFTLTHPGTYGVKIRALHWNAFSEVGLMEYKSVSGMKYKGAPFYVDEAKWQNPLGCFEMCNRVTKCNFWTWDSKYFARGGCLLFTQADGELIDEKYEIPYNDISGCRSRCWHSGSKANVISQRWYLGTFHQPYDLTQVCAHSNLDLIPGVTSVLRITQEDELPVATPFCRISEFRELVFDGRWSAWSRECKIKCQKMDSLDSGCVYKKRFNVGDLDPCYFHMRNPQLWLPATCHYKLFRRHEIRNCFQTKGHLRFLFIGDESMEKFRSHFLDILIEHKDNNDFFSAAKVLKYDGSLSQLFVEGDMPHVILTNFGIHRVVSEFTIAQFTEHIGKFVVNFRKAESMMLKPKPKIFYVGPTAPLSEALPLRTIVRLRKFDRIIRKALEPDEYWRFIDMDKITLGLDETHTDDTGTYYDALAFRWATQILVNGLCGLDDWEKEDG